MKRALCIVALILLSVSVSAKVVLGSYLPVYATESGSMEQDSMVVMRFKIHYPINSTDIDSNYMGNARMLSYIQDFLNDSPKIESITIYSSSSPDGSYETNKSLAQERGLKAKRYLVEHIPAVREIPDSIIIINPTIENWEGLRDLVELEYKYDDKNALLQIFDNENISNEARKGQLKSFNGGRAWQFVRDSLLPQLRYATWVAVWSYIEREEDLPASSLIEVFEPVKSDPILDSIVPAPVDEYPVAVDDCPVVADVGKEEEWQSKTIFAIRSNLLYDLFSLVNYSIEAPLYRDKFSFLVEHHFSWWNWGKAKNEYSIRYLTLGCEARWWFMPQSFSDGKKWRHRESLGGQFLALYGDSGKYDFQFVDDVCYQGEFWSAGISYGYAMPIGKLLNLEFSFSVGYASIAYRGYTPSDDFENLWRDPEKVGRWHYWGPTKARVSLVLPIKVKVGNGRGMGSANSNKSGKGGER